MKASFKKIGNSKLRKIGNSKLRKIGNSKGVVIPEHIRKQCALDDSVDMEVKNNTIILSKPDTARLGWEKAFAKANTDDSELLLGDAIINKFDTEEWEW